MRAQPLTAFLDELKANPRLRLGLWLVAGIVWLYALLLLRDETSRVASEHHALAKKLSRVAATAGQTVWAARVEPARAMQVELEGRMWRESTIGLAQAALQDWLNQVVQQSALPRPFLTVSAQEEAAAEAPSPALSDTASAVADAWKVSAKLSFDFAPQNFYTLMEKLVGNDKQIVVESLTIRGAPVPRAEMVLVAYFQKPVATLPKKAR